MDEDEMVLYNTVDTAGKNWISVLHLPNGDVLDRHYTFSENVTAVDSNLVKDLIKQAAQQAGFKIGTRTSELKMSQGGTRAQFGARLYFVCSRALVTRGQT